MFSYIFMKILEKRPERYDTGINILSGGHAEKIRKQIVQTYVKPGMEILDIGCGTGSLLIDAAKADANATGLDISKRMLAVAQNRIANNGMKDRIPLYTRPDPAGRVLTYRGGNKKGDSSSDRPYDS